MTTATLRPNATLVSGGTTNPHLTLSDQNVGTNILMWSDVSGSAPASGYASVALSDATGVIPAGRTIKRVRFAANIYQYWDDYEAGSGAVSFRYSDDVQASYLSFPLGDPPAGQTYSGDAVKYSSWASTPPGKSGNWTYALVDGLKAWVGGEYGATGSAGSVSEVWIEVEYTDVPAAPTAVTPANGSTVTTAIPTLGATLGAIASGQTQHAEWQLASDSGFTTNLRTVTEGAGDNRASGATTEPAGARLAPGLWYLRARSIDQYGLAGAYSATQSFTIAHVPSASIVSPSGGGTAVYAASTTLDWTFTDASPSDAQTAYQIIVERNDTGAAVYDSGKVTSALTQQDVAIGAGLKDVPLRWKVRVWDTDDTVGAYTSYGVFTLADPPVVTITAPADAGTVTTGAPTFTWTFAAGGTRTQAQAIVTVRQTSDNSVAWTTTLNSAALSATPPSTVLVNGLSYSVTVEVTDTAGLASSDTNTFTTTYVSPNPIEYTITDFSNTLGYVHIDWSTVASDSRLVFWHVYRRELPSSEWVLVYEVSDELVRHFDDYLVKANKSYMYTVTQVADRSGTLLESPVGTAMVGGAPQAESRITPIALDNYWLIVPDYPELTMLLPNVISDPNKLAFEDATYNIIGRGRHRDYGDELGYEGTITFQIRQPEVTSSLRERLEALRRARETYYLRTPFGKLIQVALGDLDWNPIAGTGAAEMGDMSFSYEEVA